MQNMCKRKAEPKLRLANSFISFFRIPHKYHAWKNWRCHNYDKSRANLIDC